MLCVVLSVCGCVSPGAHVERIAARARLVRRVIAGGAFDVVAYERRGPRADGELHVYIEGDGSPYLTPYRISEDPTPRRPVALELMVRDPAPTLYLGRPCYFGLARTRGCDPSYWTSRRFSPGVVDSLATALSAEISRFGARHVTLIGHSGGATLALLLVSRIPSVDRVITIAGNLDIAAWSILHGYAPLEGSLNPVGMTIRRKGVALYHLAGGADRNVPPHLIEAAARRIGGRVIVIPGFSHTCCWQKIWPAILDSLPPAASSELPKPHALP